MSEDDEKRLWDLMVFGFCVTLQKPDGTKSYVSPMDVMIETHPQENPSSDSK